MCLVRFLKREQIGPEELQIALALQSLYYNVFFRKTASLLRYRIRVLSRMPVNEREGVLLLHPIFCSAGVLAHRLAILLDLAGARAYIHSHDIALDNVVFLLRALP